MFEFFVALVSSVSIVATFIVGLVAGVILGVYLSVTLKLARS